MQTIEDKIVTKMRGYRTPHPFSANDLTDLGTRAAVDQALSRLARSGKLHRLGRGLYMYPRPSSLTGMTRLPTAQAIAKAIARKHGHRILPSRPYASNLLGLSTQVPAKNIFMTDGRSRTVRVGQDTIYFHHVEPSTLAASGRVAPLVFQAMRDIGRQRVSDRDVARLRRLLPAEDKKALLKNRRFAPAWMHLLIEAIAEVKEQDSNG